MTRAHRSGRWLGCILALLVASTAAAGGPTPKPAATARGDGFERFCTQWMEKLAVRERTNLQKVKFDRRDDGLIGEYTGYERAPVRCESRVKRPGTPGVGVIVYHELHYRKRGPDTTKARSSEPQVLERVEVTEIFRYDGARWTY